MGRRSRKQGSHAEMILEICSFCGRTGRDLSELVKGPVVQICDLCVRRSQSLVEGASARAPDPQRPDQGEGWSLFEIREGKPVCEPRRTLVGLHCSFCVGGQEHARYLVARDRPSAKGFTFSICDPCLRFCDELLRAPPYR